MTRKTIKSSRLSGERGIGLDKKISSSLSAQLLCGALGSLLAAIAAFFLVLALGNSLLDHTVYGEPFARRMADREFSKLQDFVTTEKITEDNIQYLNVWNNQNHLLSLIIYRGKQCLYASAARYQLDDDSEIQPLTFDPSYESAEAEYHLTLNSGNTVQAFLYYDAGDSFYIVLTVLSAAAAFVVFSGCFITMVHRKLAYIKKMKQELDILSGGALEYQVTVQGEDELGQLAYGIDQMRRSILAHQQAEERTRSASSQLVTAMSHDLRTPLTSLLAYLELLDRKKYENEEQLHLFVKKSLEQTLRIKTMADQMFEYFLVYSAEWEQPDTEPQDADTLLEQFWGEYAFSLQSKGFSVETDFHPLHGSIAVNLELLRRAFDNIYSNLLKYADPAKPIRIAFQRKESQITLSICNAVSPQRNSRESTNIGLNTCRRILEYHGGTFETREQDGRFEVYLTLPVA